MPSCSVVAAPNMRLLSQVFVPEGLVVSHSPQKGERLEKELTECRYYFLFDVII